MVIICALLIVELCVGPGVLMAYYLCGLASSWRVGSAARRVGCALVNAAIEAHTGVLDAHKWCGQSPTMWLTVVQMGADIGGMGANGTRLAGGSGCRLVHSL